MATPKLFTRDEVRSASSSTHALLIIGSKVYDATSFAKTHPGGETLITSRAGLDATQDFLDVGHSSSARAKLAALQVGVLAADATSSGPLIVILDKSDASVEAAALSRAIPDARVQALDLRSQAAAMAHPALPLADVVMMWHTLTCDAALVARCARARALVRVGVGFDNISLRDCADAGLPVCNVPNYGTEEVADHAMSLLLNLTRRTGWSEARARAGEEAHGSDGVALLAAGTRRLRGLTLGLIGCGRIGTAMAMRGKAFGLDVVRGRPRAPPCSPLCPLKSNPPAPPRPRRCFTTPTRPRARTRRWASGVPPLQRRLRRSPTSSACTRTSTPRRAAS
jgi:hypothetical protein